MKAREASPVDALDWPASTGTTDRAVFGALIWCAELRGSLVFGASERYLAEVSGRARDTVRSSLRRLMKRGLITLEKKSRPRRGGGVQSNVYRLHLPEVITLPKRQIVPSRVAHDPSAVGVYDVPDLWRGQGGLPYGSYFTWRAMPEGEWMTTAAVQAARRPSASKDTVRHHLKVLHSVGLVDRPFRASLDQPQKQKWMRIPESPRYNPYRLARSLGVDGHAEQQADRHQAERKARRLPLGLNGNPDNVPVSRNRSKGPVTGEPFSDYVKRLREDAGDALGDPDRIKGLYARWRISEDELKEAA